MNKILGISCGRPNGNSEILMKAAMMEIQKNCEAECSYIRLMEADIKSCIGCETCVKKKIAGDQEFRCVTPSNEEHMYFIEQACREADAIIFAAPIYNIMPPGILIRFLNKLHACGDYRNFVARNPKVGATISVGGSDWMDYMQPIMNMTCQEFVGGYGHVVDSMIKGFTPAFQGILADDETLERARRLGFNVAHALNTGDLEWKGEQGVCPCCHGTMLDWRGGKFVCPMCDMVIETDVMPTKFTVRNESIEKNRWGEWGMQHHLEIIMHGHQKALEEKVLISERIPEYVNYLKPVELPGIGK